MTYIRREFEKAFIKNWEEKFYNQMNMPAPREMALWAAKWAMEKCADFVEKDIMENNDGHYSYLLEDKIRQFAKELQEEK